MITRDSLSRRKFVALMGAAPLAAAVKGNRVPVGLTLYSVRDGLKQDQAKTLAAVAHMGYECVEFYAPYYSWTVDQAKEVRKQLDDLNIRCYSTHNERNLLASDSLGKAIELNKVLGSRYIVLVHPGTINDMDGWKTVADLLNTSNETMHSEGLHAGYHPNDAEFRPIDGKKPIDVLADSTDKSIMMQFDSGTCVQTGNDPASWINAHPGRVRSMHLKDWSPDIGFKALLGEGLVNWKELFAAAEGNGGIEFYLLEQEESNYPELEAVNRDLIAYRNARSR